MRTQCRVESRVGHFQNGTTVHLPSPWPLARDCGGRGGHGGGGRRPFGAPDLYRWAGLGLGLAAVGAPIAGWRQMGAWGK